MQIMNGEQDEQAPDIAFSEVYQSLIRKHDPQDLISLLLHADGVSVTRSTKLKMWLISGVIIEVPPHLRNRRWNMIPISIWVSHVEPVVSIWLKKSVDTLRSIKATGIAFIFYDHHCLVGQHRRNDKTDR